jgi:translation elongation factor EF-Ts
MSQTSQYRKKAYDEQDKEISDLQKKYNVDMQEVLNAVIDSDNDLEKAEDYLKKRTEKK